MRMILLASVLFTLIAACSNDEDKNTQKEQHILSSQFQTLDKARGVENILQDGKEKRDNSIEEQTQWYESLSVINLIILLPDCGTIKPKPENRKAK